jgi:mRNA deadenylase 3'-5' endonuclease subunit Ccr4
MSNGKGDSPRNCFTQTFRDNWDRIFGKEKASSPAKNNPEIAAEKQKGLPNENLRKHR